MGEDPREVEQRIEQTREHMGDTVSALAYKADVPSRVKGSVSDKKDAITGKLTGAKHAITGTTGDTMETAQDGARRTIGIAQENPLGLAIGATAIGFVVGSLLPSTRVEEERIGPIAAQAREQVSDLASEAVEHGKQVAQDAAEAATSAAKESGQQHAEELRDSAQESTSQMAPSTSIPQG
jgi:ElaB/YqjD/DUF883 family membrane-anchored ribosome-binding protein